MSKVGSREATNICRFKTHIPEIAILFYVLLAKHWKLNNWREKIHDLAGELYRRANAVDGRPVITMRDGVDFYLEFEGRLSCFDWLPMKIMLQVWTAKSPPRTRAAIADASIHFDIH